MKFAKIIIIYKWGLMPTKKYVQEDGGVVTEVYEIWSDTACKQAWFAVVCLVMGMAALITLPFVAVYCMFRPVMLDSHTSYKEKNNVPQQDQAPGE